MYFRFISNSLLSALLLFVVCPKHRAKDSISLEYRGPSDKPLPTVVFYVDTFENTRFTPYYPYYPFYAYKVEKDCFKLITKEIKKFDSIGVIKIPKYVGYYNYIIKSDTSSVRYVTDNKSNTKRLLNRILNVIYDTTIRRSVKSKFDDIEERMW